MGAIEDNAFRLLDTIANLDDSEWDRSKLGLGPLGPRSSRLMELTGLSEQELNTALTWLYRQNAIEAIPRQAPTERFYFRRVQGITPDGNLLYEQMKERRQTAEKEENAMSSAAAAPDPRKVFVVYGRNRAATEALFTFLHALDLAPQEWSQWVYQNGEPSPYVGAVLKKGFQVAQAFVVFMTPDDEAQLRVGLRGDHEERYEMEPTPQPRQNVIYEAGMAMATDERRTILVELGRLRPMSDVSGRHVIRMDNSAEKRKELAQRLQLAGCPVNTTGDRWLRAGDFDAALEGL